MPHAIFQFGLYPLVLGLVLLGSSPGWADSTTPVATEHSAASRHHVSVMGGAALSATPGLDSDGHYNDAGPGLGATAAYLYQVRPSLELGARADYAHTNYDATDAIFLGGQVRPGLALDAGRRSELGFGISAGFLGLVVPGVGDDSGSGSRTHYFSGARIAFSPDYRFWVSPSWALSLAADLSVGMLQDGVRKRGFYLNDKTAYVGAGASFGVVAAI